MASRVDNNRGKNVKPRLVQLCVRSQLILAYTIDFFEIIYININTFFTGSNINTLVKSAKEV
jgi:hypothetical protein